MKLHPEDPRLTSLILGELAEPEAAVVRDAIESDPALQAAVAELEKSQRFLSHSLTLTSESLHPEQRANILRAAKASASVSPASSKISHRFIFTTLAAAAVIMLTLWMIQQKPVSENLSVKTPTPEIPTAETPTAETPTAETPTAETPTAETPTAETSTAKTPDEIPLELALLPAPGPPDDAPPDDTRVRVSSPSKFSQTALARSTAMEQKGNLFLQKVAERITNSPVPKNEDFPQLRPRGELAAATQPSLPLPVQAGVSSLIWITRTIREDHKLPPLNAVRLEEILNRFSLNPTGTTAISQGTSISTEPIACPWKPSAILLLVSFRGANDASREVSARFIANPTNVRHYRLLGFSTVSDLAATPLPTFLPAKSVTSLVLEIDPATAAEDLGTIEWSVNNSPAPPISLVRSAAAEPSNDARFAALVCTYAQWLINQPAGLIDKEMLNALTRENFSCTLPADRQDFLTLIEQSLAL